MVVVLSGLLHYMYMKKLLIGAAIVVTLALVGFYMLNVYIYNEKQGSGAGQTSYKDTVYVVEGQPVQLIGGVSVVAAAPNSAAKISTRYFGNEAEGDLNGDGISDIAFLLTQDSGGSGAFFYVVAALKTDTGYIGTNAVLLGDRIAPQQTVIRDGQVIANYAERNVGEAMTTLPTVGVSKYLMVSGTELGAVQ